jgi:carboxypeptidase C (cathepsin A)
MLLRPMPNSMRCLALAGLVAVAGAPAALGQPAAAPQAAETQAERLPAARTTRHRLELGDRTLAFAATAGAITLETPQGREEADIAFVAYVLDGADAAVRPVTFVVNGGPGAASAYLQIGALGPWLLPMAAERIVPSQPVALVANPDTWLDFTDLVFVDPVGTGFSRLVDPDDGLRDRYLSIEGDVEALADFIARWLIENGRTGSPKFFFGESYGGFRGPLVAETLQTERGVGLDGMTLLSPVLDFGWWQQPEHAPLPLVSLLPSLAATRMEAEGAFSEAGLRAAEDYAAGAYVTDLLRGVTDEAAVARIVERVTALTGLDRQVVAREEGRIDGYDFSREIRRDERLRTSVYDATVASAGGRRGADPVLDAMTAPLTSAMLGFYEDTLGWLPERRYMLLNRDVSRGWDWGSGRGQPEAVGALQEVLSLDPEFRVLVAHGYTDLVTPYFGSTLILRQLEVPGDDSRVRQENYRGGHMFYMRDDARRAFREDARALYSGAAG